MQQLELYYSMQTPQNVEESPAYQRWIYQREVELSRACGQAPEADKIRFEDEHVSGKGHADLELRCRKCRHAPQSSHARKHLLTSPRRALATSQFLFPHTPTSTHSSPQSDEEAIITTHIPPPTCAHYFLDPLSWMRPELEQGKLDGRLECPKCRTNVGKYAWQGMQCSCGTWVVPGISLAKGRIDEVKSGTARAAEAAGIRRPPGARGGGRGGGSENL